MTGNILMMFTLALPSYMRHLTAQEDRGRLRLWPEHGVGDFRERPLPFLLSHRVPQA